MEYIETTYEDTTIRGVIECHEKFFLKVRIVHPYTCWTECSNINGFAKANPKHFQTVWGDYRAKELLIKCYRKMEILEARWNPLVLMFNKMERAIVEVKEKTSQECYKNIEFALSDWWRDWIFGYSTSGLMLSYGQEKDLAALIHHFNLTGEMKFKPK